MFFDPLFYLVAATSVVLLGLAKGGLVGVGLLATPLLALVIPPLEAAAAMLPIMLLQDTIAVWTYRHSWDGRILTVMLPGVVIGVGAAWFTAASLAVESSVRLAVGIMLLLLVLGEWCWRAGLAMIRRERQVLSWHYEEFAPKPHRPPVAIGVAAGVAAGFAGLLANAASPPFLIYMLSQRLEKLTIVGTAVLFFAGADLAKVPGLLLLGQLTPATLLVSASLFPLAIATNFAGIWLVRRMPNDMF